MRRRSRFFVAFLVAAPLILSIQPVIASARPSSPDVVVPVPEAPDTRYDPAVEGDTACKLALPSCADIASIPQEERQSAECTDTTGMIPKSSSPTARATADEPPLADWCLGSASDAQWRNYRFDACRIKTGYAALVNSRGTVRGGFFWAETNYVYTGFVAGLTRWAHRLM